MRVLVTGADGFVGRNLLVCLRERGIEAVPFTRGMPLLELPLALEGVDFVFHLAGVNRPKKNDEFMEGNAGLTESLCEFIRSTGRQIPVLFTSSIQAEADNPYGTSKRAAEDLLATLEKEINSPVYIYRLPNVFGKWSRPNYNSVVATFCFNIANDLPVQINDPSACVCLVYIDDVIADFNRLLDDRPPGLHWREVAPVYTTTVGELADQIRRFKASRNSMIIEPVGSGLVRALYATYLSYMRPEQFSYALPAHMDARGSFVEMMKTRDSGQFSFFTAHPGVTRGGHYHHSKNEKFLVVRGKARFGFRHVMSGEVCELFVDAAQPKIVETVPGWAHDITNVGDTEMVVMLWANEIFDRQHPDTIPYKV